MKAQALNIFVLNDTTTIAHKLGRFFKKRFGDKLNASLFSNSESCLINLNRNVQVVILNDYLYDPISKTGVNVTELVKKIKEKNVNTEVIILSSEKGLRPAISALRVGANEYIPNKHGAWTRLQMHIHKIVNNPINFLDDEFEVSEFIGILTLIFLNMGIISILALRFLE